MTHYFQVDSLSKTIKQKTILSGIHLSVSTGEIVGLFGRNGSGKSTLLSILFGTIKSDYIFLKYDDKIISNRNRFNKIFSFSPQFNYLPQNISVKKLIWVVVDKYDIETFYNDSVIEDFLHLKVSQLSLGIQKYLQTKLILFNSSKFCLLDEPYSGLSPILCEKLNEFILKQSKYKGVLIADHNYSYLLNISTKNYLLKDGNIFLLKDKFQLVDFGYISTLNI